MASDIIRLLERLQATNAIVTIVQHEDRKIKGYIKAEINLETLTEKEIIRMYENALNNKKFPNEAKKQSIKKELDLYNERMSRSHE